MASDFLSRLSEDDRARLERIGQTMELAPRHHLLVRGEKGGDVFRVERGQLEIIDRRSRPEVILDVLGPGELVGELGFIDGTPRSADAFASPGCVVTRWPVVELQDLLATDAVFAARFWRAMAEEVADRLRDVTSAAVTGGLRGANASAGTGTDGNATMMARSLLGASLGGLAQVDQQLRRNPGDAKAARRVAELLDLLAADLMRRQQGGADPTTLARAVRKLSQQVHPYLLRSTTAELTLSAPDGFAGGPTVLRHVLFDKPHGDGALGLAVDRWLLEQPRISGMRARHQRATDRLEAMLSTHLGPLRIVLINCAQGPLLERVWRQVSRRPGELWIVEPTREALMELDTSLPRAGAKMKLRMVQEPLGAPHKGSSLRNLADVDAIVADALLDYLPARMATDTVRSLSERLGPRGTLLMTALAPSTDEVLWTHLLAWPIITRSPGALLAILRAAGCTEPAVSELDGSGLLARARSAQALAETATATSE
jgi:CRP/FNR family transcriptional regulator, cyclic AMP receptor protein